MGSRPVRCGNIDSIQHLYFAQDLCFALSSVTVPSAATLKILGIYPKVSMDYPRRPPYVGNVYRPRLKTVALLVVFLGPSASVDRRHPSNPRPKDDIFR